MYMLVGQIHVSKFGFMPILRKCRLTQYQQSVSVFLALFFRKERNKNTVKPTRVFIRNYANSAIKEQPFMLQKTDINNDKETT